MDLKDYDYISVPKELNAAIEKGINRGITYKKDKQGHKKWRLVVATIIIVGGLTTTVANVPILAKELVKIPVVGELIKILNFTGSIAEGGVRNDGLYINVDSYEEESIDLYFTRNNNLESDVPVYEFTYHQYPYELEMKLQGVRGFDIQAVKAKLEQLPLVKDVYNIITLDDSSYHIVVAFKENVAVQMEEYKNPGRLHITMTREEVRENTTPRYFVQSETYANNEAMALSSESLSADYPHHIQKTDQGNFVLELGPYETKEEALTWLMALEENQEIAVKWHIAKRKIGQSPK